MTVTAKPKVHVFGRSENAQEIAFSSDVPSSSEGIMKWFSFVFLVTPTLGKHDIWCLTNRPWFTIFAVGHGATGTAFSNRQLLRMFAPSATMTKPTYRAYIVENPPEGSDRKARWVGVGAVWPHKNRNGFDLVIATGIAVLGRIACVPPIDESDDA